MEAISGRKPCSYLELYLQIQWFSTILASKHPYITPLYVVALWLRISELTLNLEKLLRDTLRLKRFRTTDLVVLGKGSKTCSALSTCPLPTSDLYVREQWWPLPPKLFHWGLVRQWLKPSALQPLLVALRAPVLQHPG